MVVRGVRQMPALILRAQAGFRSSYASGGEQPGEAFSASSKVRFLQDKARKKPGDACMAAGKSFKPSGAAFKAPGETFKAAAETFKSSATFFKFAGNTFKLAAKTFKLPGRTFKVTSQNFKIPDAAFNASGEALFLPKNKAKGGNGAGAPTGNQATPKPPATKA
jgi:hypothetical protein